MLSGVYDIIEHSRPPVQKEELWSGCVKIFTFRYVPRKTSIVSKESYKQEGQDSVIHVSA